MLCVCKRLAARKSGQGDRKKGALGAPELQGIAIAELFKGFQFEELHVYIILWTFKVFSFHLGFFDSHLGFFEKLPSSNLDGCGCKLTQQSHGWWSTLEIDSWVQYFERRSVYMVVAR